MAINPPSWPPPPSNYGGPDPGMNGPGMNASGTPPRHGCLTAWLVFALFAQALTILVNSLAYPFIHRALPAVTPLIAGILVLGSVLSIVCLVALFRWRRWGFYGIAAITVLVCVLNIVIGVGVGRSLSGFVGIAVLYGVLNIGGPYSAWRYLK